MLLCCPGAILFRHVIVTNNGTRETGAHGNTCNVSTYVWFSLEKKLHMDPDTGKRYAGVNRNSAVGDQRYSESGMYQAGYHVRTLKSG